MKKPINFAGACLILGAALALAASPAVAGDEGWKDTAELGLVSTSGNSENTTFNFKNTLSRQWDKSGFALKAGGVQVDTTTKGAIFATATADNVFSVTQDPDFSAKTAESYYLNGRYDRKITDTFGWFTGAGWDRNTFAGIDNRYIGEAGVANVWRDADDMKFRTSYGLTYTKQEDVGPKDPLVDDTFLGARFGWEYLNKLNENTTYENLLVLDLNVDETDDWRADMINSIAVAMSKRLALKVGLQLLYDNLPTTRLITIDNTGGFVGIPLDTRVPLDDLDTIFSASLVVSF